MPDDTTPLDGRDSLFHDGIPTLLTERLRLRPFQPSDAADVHRLASDRRIAETTMTIPHPYPPGAAEEWISHHERMFVERKGIGFAITDRESGEYYGTIGLILKLEDDRAEIGYWIGVPYWGRGFVTEAARAVIDWGFEALELHKMYAVHFHTNPASGAVMRKLGMKPEGVLRQHAKKWGEPVDLHFYGVLRGEWEENAKRLNAER